MKTGVAAPKPSAATFGGVRDELRRAFDAGVSTSLAWRRAQLLGLARMLEDHLGEAVSALEADLSRPTGEAQGEVVLTIREAKEAAASMRGWSAAQKVGTHLMFLPGSAEVRRSAYGVALVIAPFNYPLWLALMPVVGALAAGNVCVLKPSELTPACSAFLARRVGEYVHREAVRVVEGGVAESKALLATRWDFIFFTGSPRVGRIVGSAAAERLTPCALELGGKAPVVVHRSASSVREAARRIVNTKMINLGQTCMAPDYVLVDSAVRAELVAALLAEISAQFGSEPRDSADLGWICTPAQYERVVGLLRASGGVVRQAGKAPADAATRYVPPTLVEGPDLGSDLMSEEIFGPILPIVPFESLADAVTLIRRVDPTPLALYAFGADGSFVEALLASTQSGTACVNDCFVQNLNHTLPFGGVGTSGHGAAHGRWTFETFTYPRALLWRHGRWDIDQTVPLPLRHVSAASSSALRPRLLDIMLRHAPYVKLPRWALAAALLAALALAYPCALKGALQGVASLALYLKGLLELRCSI